MISLAFSLFALMKLTPAIVQSVRICQVSVRSEWEKPCALGHREVGSRIELLCAAGQSEDCARGHNRGQTRALEGGTCLPGQGRAGQGQSVNV